VPNADGIPGGGSFGFSGVSCNAKAVVLPANTREASTKNSLRDLAMFPPLRILEGGGKHTKIKKPLFRAAFFVFYE
jgi:hypothetical protein